MDRPPFLHSPPFPARFAGECAAGDVIDEDEPIVMADGEPWHTGCFGHDDCPDNATCE